MGNCCIVNLAVTDDAEVTLTASEAGGVNLELEDPYVGGGTWYQGDYEVTPSDSVQVLPTRGMLMENDVTVGKIPSNYGLITWDGSALMVS